MLNYGIWTLSHGQQKICRLLRWNSILKTVTFTQRLLHAIHFGADVTEQFNVHLLSYVILLLFLLSSRLLALFISPSWLQTQDACHAPWTIPSCCLCTPACFLMPVVTSHFILFRLFCCSFLSSKIWCWGEFQMSSRPVLRCLKILLGTSTTRPLKE